MRKGWFSSIRTLNEKGRLLQRTFYFVFFPSVPLILPIRCAARSCPRLGSWWTRSPRAWPRVKTTGLGYRVLEYNNVVAQPRLHHVPLLVRHRRISSIFLVSTLEREQALFIERRRAGILAVDRGSWPPFPPFLLALLRLALSPVSPFQPSRLPDVPIVHCPSLGVLTLPSTLVVCFLVACSMVGLLVR